MSTLTDVMPAGNGQEDVRGRRRFLINLLRRSARQFEIAAVELDEITAALTFGIISCVGAVAWLRDGGLAEYVIPNSDKEVEQ